MSKFQRTSRGLLCCLLLALAFSSVGAQQVSASDTNTFTGSASVTDFLTLATTGSMNVGRTYHTATLLNNGKVLVAGGYGQYISDLTSAELFDSTTGTWSSTGRINVGRNHHTATLLNNGKVLVVGGMDGESSAELYDPDSGTWSTTGSMNVDRYAGHTAILLNNGKVLVAGGMNYDAPSYPLSNYLSSAELYDPATGTWSSTGSMNTAREYHTATLLLNGNVLVTGGRSDDSNLPPSLLASAELFDPETGTWSTTGSLNNARCEGHSATLLNNGKVLVAGGYGGDSIISAELYDPFTGSFITLGRMNNPRRFHTATLLNNGKVFFAGGDQNNGADLYDPFTGSFTSLDDSMNIDHYYHTASLLNNGKVLLAGGHTEANGWDSPKLVTLIPGNTLTGTLTLPSGWLNSNVTSVQFVGTTSAAAVNAGALSNDNNTWDSWIAATFGATVSTTWAVSGEGANMPVYLRLRDINDQMATVVTGTVNVDLTKPTSTMTALPTISPANFALSWTGSDALSGLSTYDLQVRAGLDGAWTDVLNNTTNTSTNYTGANGITYYFRVRAIDAAGNVEDWPPYDISTFVDNEAPTGTLVINNDTVNTNETSVILTLSASDSGSGITQMSFSNDGTIWSGWQAYATSGSWTLATGDGSKTVYVRFMDAVWNVSPIISATIILDTVVPSGTITIANGDAWTNTDIVSLELTASDMLSGIADMSFSNDGTTWSTWEPYAASKTWTLVAGDGPKTVYARYKDNAENVSLIVSGAIILDAAPLTVQFSNATLAVGENAGTIVITATLSRASVRTVTVSYATSDNSAITPEDYTAASGTLTFAPNETNKEIVIPILDDSLDEVDETFTLALSSPDNAAFGSPTSTIITITDNDGPEVAFSGTTYSAAEGDGSIVISVTLNAASVQTVTIDYATGDGTGTAGNDYIAANGTLTFGPGEQIKSYNVLIVDDNTLLEPDETLTLQLSNPTNATLGMPSASTLAIVDNDVNSAPVDVIALSDPSQPVDVSVNTPAGVVQIILEDVRAGGTITSLVSVSAPDQPPVNFSLLGFHFEVTAPGIDFGRATIRFPYRDSDVAAAGVPEDSLRLLHLEDGQWKDITTDLDTTANLITGITESFSPFVLGVQDMQNCAISLNSSAVYTGKLNVQVYSNSPGATEMLVSNDAGFSGAHWQPYHSAFNWTISDPGSRIVTLLVYTRLRDANRNLLCSGVSLIDDIFYDPLAPNVISVAVQSGEGRVLKSQGLGNVTLQLSAADQQGGSGVVTMQISTNSNFTGARWQSYASTPQVTAQPGDKVYVRVRDGVGNISNTGSVSISGQRYIFMPQVVR